LKAFHEESGSALGVALLTAGVLQKDVRVRRHTNGVIALCGERGIGARAEERAGRPCLRYLLARIERQLSGIDINDEAMTATGEHILPENPGQVGWEHFSNEAHDRSFERLGNYSLLERGLNGQQAGNAAFAQKLQAYAQSQYRTSSELTQFTEWTEETIGIRQAALARIAKSVWSLTFGLLDTQRSFTTRR
jgi:hypothetical protein